VTSCSLINRYQHFRGTWRIRLKSTTMGRAGKMVHDLERGDRDRICERTNGHSVLPCIYNVQFFPFILPKQQVSPEFRKITSYKTPHPIIPWPCCCHKFMAARLIKKGFGLDDWIYWQLLLPSLLITITYNKSSAEPFFLDRRGLAPFSFSDWLDSVLYHLYSLETGP
jgi:hypothetical protein